MKAYRVLAVDDSSTVRAVVAKTLRLSGVNVTRFGEASTGHEALGMLRGESFDLVFCDLNMPGMTGYELVEALEREGRLDRIAVVILSSIDDPASRAKLMDKGVRGYLRKPAKPEELGPLVERVMGATHGSTD